MNKEEIEILSNFTKQKCKDNCEESGNCHDCWIDYETVQVVENLMKEYLKSQSQLDIANNKLNKIKEKTEFDMKMWSKEDGFILINGNEILSIIGGNDE